MQHLFVCLFFLLFFSSDKEKQHGAINKLIALLGDSDAEKASCLCHQGMLFCNCHLLV